MGLELIELVPIFMVFILYFLGMPIVYALFGSTFFYFTFIDTTSKNWLILQKVMTSTQSFSMLAIPFFVMAGSVMNYGGISDKMMDFAEVLTGHMKGGLAQVNIPKRIPRMMPNGKNNPQKEVIPCFTISFRAGNFSRVVG